MDYISIICVFCITLFAPAEFSLGLLCNQYEITNTPLQDSFPDDDVERNTTLHSTVAWSGRVVGNLPEPGTIEIQWDRPSDVSGVYLCVYGVHYYPAIDITHTTEHYTQYVSPIENRLKIIGLSRGTTYHVYVEAIFNDSIPSTNPPTPILKSWILITTTRGIGPNNPCKCDPRGTADGKLDQCDRDSGQCECKVPVLTNGLNCDWCVEESYMNDILGCTACDQCDEVRSKKTCQPVPGGHMQCDCKEGFIGKHCRSCHNEYYAVGDLCKPCNCSGNEKQSATEICNANGTCIACDKHTYGDHCEQCYPGYVGDALKGTCGLPDASSDASKVDDRNVVIGVLVPILVLLLILLVAATVRHFVIQRRRRAWLNQLPFVSGSGFNFSQLTKHPYSDDVQPANAPTVTVSTINVKY